MGGGTALNAKAAGTLSHGATHCQYIKTCTGGHETWDSWSYTCSDCGDVYYEGEERVCDECHAILYEHYKYSKCDCGAETSRKQHTDRDPHSTIIRNCSSSYPCTNGHTSLSTVDHYYCTSHNYLGTSPTCPGLTVNPSPSPLILYYGQEQQITANQQPSEATVNYSGGDSNIAVVSSTGLVTSKNVGTTEITVEAIL